MLGRKIVAGVSSIGPGKNVRCTGVLLGYVGHTGVHLVVKLLVRHGMKVTGLSINSVE